MIAIKRCNFTSIKYPTQVFINNKFHQTPTQLPIINPSTNQIISQLSISTQQQISDAFQSCVETHHRFTKNTSPAHRSKILLKMGQAIQDNNQYFSILETLDSGKPITQSREDISYCVDTFNYFSTRTYLQGRTVHNPSTFFTSQTQREPLGILALITPWNYPLMQAVFKIAAAFAFGNSVVLKPSEHSSLTCLSMADLCKDILEPGQLQVLPGGKDVGSSLLKENFDGVSFTGSSLVGKSILRESADFLRKTGIELGGKSAVIVDHDADLNKAVHDIFWGCMYNMGQNCVAASRVYVHDKIYKQFLDKMRQFALDNVRLGDPMQNDVNFGPLNNKEQFQKAQSYVKLAELDKLEFLVYPGDFKIPLQGFYQAPAIIFNVEENHRIAREEIFGPVMTILRPFTNYQEVIQKANDSNYGLGAAIFTQNMKTAELFIRNLEAGSVWVNSYNNIPVNMPFGGYKQSGYSKEIGEECIDEYTKIKSVYYDNN